MLHVGPDLLVLVIGSFPPGQLSVELVNVVGWLTCGDLALDSCARPGIENHSSYFSRRSGSSFYCLWLSGGGGGC